MRSFNLHQQLSKTLGVDCGYRPVSTLSMSASSKANGALLWGACVCVQAPQWLDMQSH